LLYLYPGLLSVETMQRVLSLPTVVPYLDAPIQHASPRLLRAMKRPGDMAATLRFFQSLRRERPELVLRTTVMLGFPGEEEEDIEQLADFLATVEFDHLGTYRYSPEIGTPAADLPRRPAAEDVADREARILDLQREISLARQQQRLGGSYEVVIDEVAPAAEIAELWEALQGGFWTEKAERERAEKVFPHLERVGLGRSQHFGYDLDGQVLLAKPDCQPGDWVEARFTGVTEFDCWAVPA
jgi:tRNA A37 methylthiotransferase MiaB